MANPPLDKFRVLSFLRFVSIDLTELAEWLLFAMKVLGKLSDGMCTRRGKSFQGLLLINKFNYFLFIFDKQRQDIKELQNSKKVALVLDKSISQQKG